MKTPAPHNPRSVVSSLSRRILASVPEWKGSGDTRPQAVWMACIAGLRCLEPTPEEKPRYHPQWIRALQDRTGGALDSAFARYRIPLRAAVGLEIDLSRDRLDAVRTVLLDPAWDEAFSQLGVTLLPYLYEDLVRAGGGEPTPGMVYTPEKVGLPFSRRALEAWCEDQPLGRCPRILDMGCGAGLFLLWSYRWIRRRWPAITRAKVSHSLFGIDLDRHALEVAWLALTLKMILDSDGRSFYRPASGSLVLGDAVAPVGPIGPFKEYDLILGNPPWVSLKGKHAKHVYGDALDDILKAYGASTYRPNLCELFVIRGLQLLRRNGVLAFLVPDRLAENLQFEGVRRWLMERGELVDVEFDLKIPGVIADNMAVIVRRRPPRSTHHVVVRTGERTLKISQKEFAGHLYGSLRPPRLYLREGERLPFSLHLTTPLGELVRTSVGFIAKPDLLSHSRKSGSQVPVYRGRDIVPYGVTGHHYFHFTRENLAGGTQDVKKLGQPRKILVRKTGEHLIAALDESGYYPEQSLYFLHKPKPGISMKMLTAWLNSRALARYTESDLMTNRGSISQIKKVHLERIPVPVHFLVGTGVEDWLERLHALVDERCGAVRNPPRARELDDRIEAILCERLK